MSFWQAYRSLDVEQKRLLKEKQYSATRPVGELLAFLQPVAAYDRVGDQMRNRFGCTFALLSVFGIIGLIVAGRHLGSAGLLAWVVMIAAIIVSGFLWMATRKTDLSDNLRAFALPVLALFREDIDAAEPMQIRLDLRPPLSPAKKTVELAPTKEGVYYKVVETQYVDPWLDASAMLADGSRLRWSITDAIRERRKTKKTPRGKIKTKTKYSRKTTIEVELSLKKKSYDVGTVGEASVKSGENRNSVRLSRVIHSADLNPLDPKALIDAVAEIYRSAAPAVPAS